MQRYVITTKVRSVERVSQVSRVSKRPDGSTFEERVDLGWFVRFEGSFEAIHLGFDEPALTVGQAVRITIEGA